MTKFPLPEAYRGKTLGIDTMVFIYHIEDRRPFVSFTFPLFEAIEQGTLQAVASYLTLMEVLVKPKREGNDHLARRYQSLLEAFPHLKIHPLGKREAEAASELRARYPALRPPDAIVLGTAIAHKAQAFLTNDPHFKTADSEVKILMLEEFLNG